MNVETKHDDFRILAVDDDDGILALYREIFSGPSLEQNELYELASELFSTAKKENVPFNLTVSRQGKDAVEAVKQSVADDEPYSVAFIDVRMPPGQDGVKTAQEIRGIDPHIEIVIVTAYTDVPPKTISQTVAPVTKLLYIQKPFNPLEIYHFATSLSSKWLTELQCVQHEKEQKKTILELKTALEEVKTLKGLLPICSSCKKIRDDQGYWNSLESYIQSNSDAQFTHGLCPECSDNLYGNEDWYIKKS